MKSTNQKVKQACVLLGILLVVQVLILACKKDDEPKPQGRLIFYTQLDKKEFDAIDIYVDKKFVGKLISPNAKRPGCNQATIGDMVKIDLPVGDHLWSAKQFLGGKEIDGWDERSEKVTAEECEYVKLTE